MKEQNKAERVNILGIGIDEIRVDRAVSLTGQCLEKNKFEYIAFVNTTAALWGQEQSEFIDLMEGAFLVLPGDNNIEHAVGISHWEEEGTSYQAQYFKRLFQKVNRHRGTVFFLAQQEEQLELTKKIVEKNYDRICLENYLWTEDGDVDALINHINSFAPDVLVICADYEKTGIFLRENKQKINAGICICAASMAAGENYVFPEWIQILHLEKAYISLYKKPLHYWHSKLLKSRMKKNGLEQETAGKDSFSDEEC